MLCTAKQQAATLEHSGADANSKNAQKKVSGEKEINDAINTIYAIHFIRLQREIVQVIWKLKVCLIQKRERKKKDICRTWPRIWYTLRTIYCNGMAINRLSLEANILNGLLVFTMKMELNERSTKRSLNKVDIFLTSSIKLRRYSMNDHYCNLLNKLP